MCFMTDNMTFALTEAVRRWLQGRLGKGTERTEPGVQAAAAERRGGTV